MNDRPALTLTPPERPYPPPDPPREEPEDVDMSGQLSIFGEDDDVCEF